jgi:hypothetical protein
MFVARSDGLIINLSGNLMGAARESPNAAHIRSSCGPGADFIIRETGSGAQGIRIAGEERGLESA